MTSFSIDLNNAINSLKKKNSVKKTKIVCTIGPASLEAKTIKQMIKAGMNCARINTSHGSIEQYQKIIDNAKSVSDVAIMIDTKGPEVRLRCKNSCEIKIGDVVEVGFNKKNDFYFDFDFYKKIKEGQSIFVDDGMINFFVKKKKKNSVILLANNDGNLRDRIGVHLPDIKLNLPIISKHDKKVLAFARETKVDFVAVSFTRNKKDILKIKKVLKDSEISIIAKIEDREGVDNLDEILSVSDGIMVARGDLGVELPSEIVPTIQKEIAKKCNEKGKIVIVATQMLASMEKNPRPTRAETNDVANAILDGADAIMLSNETTIGKYPVQSVQEMNRIAIETERFVKNQVPNDSLVSVSDTLTKSIHNMSKHLPIDKIVAVTKSGFTARMIARFKLKQSIIAVTNNNRVKRKLCLVYGVTPIVFTRMPLHEKVLKSACFCFSKKLIKNNDFVIFTAGILTEEEMTSNLIELHKVSDLTRFC